ncbi:hypothetical protein Athai_54860 [Actinocatenispora thailandica]|uniref:ESX-1 secretion-associated protein n=1 Tax=Actinocatenispora thailandica TaxID=227318 RepID=A0A7R7HZ93_9ACTN|nr:hypothetical protein [Actinocatenispora thailandica]BCJ37983.1 hypothetical protein Athai_54860 [Actinocatenispora thailandica]
MGDGKSSGAQQVDTYNLIDAATKVKELAGKEGFGKALSAFQASMRNYSVKTLDKVAADQSSKSKDFQSVGANASWVNPFGHFGEADHLLAHVDDVHQAAVEDGRDLMAALVRMAGALKAAADLYDQNEDKNSAVSKEVMRRLMTGSATSYEA